MRLLGWAKSFTAKLDSTEMAAQDNEIIGSVSLFWNIVKASFPCEITKYMQNCLDAAHMPSIATRNIPEGYCCGFLIEYNGKAYTFRSAARAPPESLATCGYNA
ncbi:hypothetical protein FPV67DRAFT_1417426 [Lyophyllum atratum]|nr:hypothetical protein FPV67DRAFT_1417426 [Lyophyllum atratum]